MAKKKTIQELQSQNILFEYNNQKVQALKFDPNSRKVEILYIKEERKEQIAFIHLPKNIKRLIAPL